MKKEEKNQEEKNQERYRKIGILVSSILLLVVVSWSLSSYELNQAGGTANGVRSEKENTGPFQKASEKAALLEQAKITDTQASETVLEANQGASVVSVKLDNENEVVVYEITIKTQDGNMMEVFVDAVENKIVLDESEGEPEQVSLECL